MSFVFKITSLINDVNDVVERISDTEVRVLYPEGVRAVTPGQACVFYQGDICLGGGFIDQVFKDKEKREY